MSETLIIQYDNSALHETMIGLFWDYFGKAMDEQEEKLNSQRRFSLFRVTNQSFTAPSGKLFIPDLAISKKPTCLLIAIEVAFSQSLQDVRSKLETYYRPLDNLLAVIILNIVENPSYSSPSLNKEAKEDADLWNEIWEKVRPGEEIKVRERRWLGRTTCDIIVWTPMRDQDSGIDIFNEVSNSHYQLLWSLIRTPEEIRSEQ